MTTKPTATATARRTAKNNMFILTNNNFARASRYIVHFFAIGAQLPLYSEHYGRGHRIIYLLLSCAALKLLETFFLG